MDSLTFISAGTSRVGGFCTLKTAVYNRVGQRVESAVWEVVQEWDNFIKSTLTTLTPKFSPFRAEVVPNSENIFSSRSHSIYPTFPRYTQD